MRRIYALVGLLFLLGACSPRAATPTPEAADTATPILPTHAFQQPTEAPAIATAAAATRIAAEAGGSTELDPVAIERGQGRYEALECGSCHGAAGEGTDDGPALAGTTLSEDAFITFLRTGGTIGNDHLYATNRLSTSGGTNLYTYVLSLSAE